MQTSFPAAGTKTTARAPGKSACLPCRTKHLTCDGGRPCARCISTRNVEQCRDAEPRKRGRPTEASRKAAAAAAAAAQEREQSYSNRQSRSTSEDLHSFTSASRPTSALSHHFPASASEPTPSHRGLTVQTSPTTLQLGHALPSTSRIASAPSQIPVPFLLPAKPIPDVLPPYETMTLDWPHNEAVLLIFDTQARLVRASNDFLGIPWQTLRDHTFESLLVEQDLPRWNDFIEQCLAKSDGNAEADPEQIFAFSLQELSEPLRRSVTASDTFTFEIESDSRFEMEVTAARGCIYRQDQIYLAVEVRLRKPDAPSQDE